jgi:hypothetical protein
MSGATRDELIVALRRRGWTYKRIGKAVAMSAPWQTMTEAPAGARGRHHARQKARIQRQRRRTVN